MRPRVTCPVLVLMLCTGWLGWLEPALPAPSKGMAHEFRVTGERVVESKDKARIVATGSACATWDRVEVRADRIEADRMPGLPAAPPLKLLARGHVTAKRKDVALHGAELRFDVAQGTIEMTEVRGQCQLKGYELSLCAKKVTFHLLAHKLTASGEVSVQTPKGKADAESVEVDLEKSTFKATKLRLRLHLN